ncbi:MAG: hypothetical protein GXX93_09505 [Anaerolineae bacterium]|nr:hypothetical protein [Anaerolineae bacterium]
MSKKRPAAGQRSLSRARATRRPAATPATPSRSAAKSRRPALSPAVTRWLRTSKIPIIIAVLVLVAILVAMFFRLTDAVPAASLPPAVHLTARWLANLAQPASAGLPLALPLGI